MKGIHRLQGHRSGRLHRLLKLMVPEGVPFPPELPDRLLPDVGLKELEYRRHPIVPRDCFLAERF